MTNYSDLTQLGQVLIWLWLAVIALALLSMIHNAWRHYDNTKREQARHAHRVEYLREQCKNNHPTSK